eukprot:scaffold11769_cov97-Isochrysis_galbana.AAC.7
MRGGVFAWARHETKHGLVPAMAPALSLDPSHPNAAQYRHTALRQLGVRHPERPASAPGAGGGTAGAPHPCPARPSLPAPYLPPVPPHPPALPPPPCVLAPPRHPPFASHQAQGPRSSPPRPGAEQSRAVPAIGDGERGELRKGGGSAYATPAGRVAVGAMVAAGASSLSGGNCRVAALGQMVEALREERRRRKEAKKEKKRRKRDLHSTSEQSPPRGSRFKRSSSKQGKHKRRRREAGGGAEAEGSSDGEEGPGGGVVAASASAAREEGRGHAGAAEGRDQGRDHGCEQGCDSLGSSSSSAGSLP